MQNLGQPQAGAGHHHNYILSAAEMRYLRNNNISIGQLVWRLSHNLPTPTQILQEYAIQQINLKSRKIKSFQKDYGISSSLAASFVSLINKIASMNKLPEPQGVKPGYLKKFLNSHELVARILFFNLIKNALNFKKCYSEEITKKQFLRSMGYSFLESLGQIVGYYVGQYGGYIIGQFLGSFLGIIGGIILDIYGGIRVTAIVEQKLYLPSQDQIVYLQFEKRTQLGENIYQKCLTILHSKKEDPLQTIQNQMKTIVRNQSPYRNRDKQDAVLQKCVEVSTRAVKAFEMIKKYRQLNQ